MDDMISYYYYLKVWSNKKKDIYQYLLKIKKRDFYSENKINNSNFWNNFKLHANKM